ncbi:Uncharacterized protein JF76_04320 [Lactobacillus kullabergensis]|uniref:Glycoside hydrolase family 42 N-terminal domain-containing protein n=1 Tax=Lactobacillus kullabergensis TaxID=1218493 RepID=A0A0F4LHQ8_9LACO|nr:hypothetical protein [Lactobacillus kullabergensis]KJY58115.1 Uncharacterized protein JF76_04320 [Lactobacillus kullabergensis]
MTFIYTLRYMLDPRANTPTKDEKLIEFVKKGKIDDVAFFINGEELNHSHLTKAETQVWLDAIKPLQKKLSEIGVTTSLNPWTTIMHSDRGYQVNPEIGFNTFVDLDGNKAKDMACPADPTWRKYLANTYAQYASIHPRRLWLEDDFRHYNHSPLKLMCFCEYHMQLYNEKLGKKETRAEFVKKMLQPGKPTKERQVYLDQARQEMIETEHIIEQAVHKVSPETDLAQMTSYPNWHALEGRDWDNLFKAQAGKGHPKVARPHLPAYNEVAPLQYGRYFEEYTRITAAFLGEDAELYPELESYMYSPLVKSTSFTAFQIITSALIGSQGILLNLFDMMGNGINDSWHYAEMLAQIKPFVNQLLENRLPIDHLRGIRVLVDQDSSYYLQTKTGKNVEELLPHEKNWASLLGAFGFATTILPISKKTSLKNEVVAISGQLLRNLTNAQVTELVKNNFVLLDGESVQVLLDRKLGNLLHIEKAEWHPVRSNYQVFEQADGQTVDGVKSPRITMLQQTGNYLKIDYQPQSSVKVWSFAYNAVDEKLGNVMAVIDQHIVVLPMDQDLRYGWESQFTTYKQGLLQQMLDSIKPVDYLVDMPNVKLLVENNGQKVWLANFTLDDYQQLKWHLGEPLKSNEATIIRKVNNTVRKTQVQIRVENDIAFIDEALAPLETIQILF